jgi:hypothetical protein
VNDLVALFPQEWIRDAASPYLLSAYHDVPWAQQELVRDCVLSRRKKSAWYAIKPVQMNVGSIRVSETEGSALPST